nr:hypothetical protein [Tanacetum cinerariifolium]
MATTAAVEPIKLPISCFFPMHGGYIDCITSYLIQWMIRSWLMSTRGYPPTNHHRGGGRMTVHHHNRILWCRAMMAQPLGVSHNGQPPKSTAVVAVEPTLTTTAAPWWCRACGGDPPLAKLIVIIYFWLFIDFPMKSHG